MPGLIWTFGAIGCVKFSQLVTRKVRHRTLRWKYANTLIHVSVHKVIRAASFIFATFLIFRKMWHAARWLVMMFPVNSNYCLLAGSTRWWQRFYVSLCCVFMVDWWRFECRNEFGIVTFTHVPMAMAIENTFLIDRRRSRSTNVHSSCHVYALRGIP